MNYTDTQSKLTALLNELRGTPTFERVKLYVAKFSGGRALSEYLGDPTVKLSDKDTLSESLVTILVQRDWSRLPELSANLGVEAEKATPAQLVAEQPRMFTEAEVKSMIRREVGDVLGRIATVLKQS